MSGQKELPKRASCVYDNDDDGDGAYYVDVEAAHYDDPGGGYDYEGGPYREYYESDLEKTTKEEDVNKGDEERKHSMVAEAAAKANLEARRRRLAVFGLAALAGLVILAVVVGLAVGLSGGKETGEASSPPGTEIGPEDGSHFGGSDGPNMPYRGQ